MQIIKTFSANCCPLRLCLLVAFSFCIVGCDSSDSGTNPPAKSDKPAVDKDVPDPGLKSSSKGQDEDKASMPGTASGQESPRSQTPADDTPKSMQNDSDGDSDDEDDSPGPSLNAPKSVSQIPASEQGKGKSSMTGASPAESEGNASLAITFLVMECGIRRS